MLASSFRHSPKFDQILHLTSMAYILFFIALAYLMAGGNHDKGSSTLSKQRDKISQRSGAQNLFERNETLLKEYFYNNMIVYGNLIDVEDLNHRFTELVEAQRWEMAMMSALEIRLRFLKSINSTTH